MSTDSGPRLSSLRSTGGRHGDGETHGCNEVGLLNGLQRILVSNAANQPNTSAGAQKQPVAENHSQFLLLTVAGSILDPAVTTQSGGNAEFRQNPAIQDHPSND